MNKKLCLFIAIAIIFVSLVSVYTQRGEISRIAVPRLETMTLMGIFPKTQEVSLGKMATVSVAILGPEESLSGVSMRVFISGKIDPVITPSPKVINSGWQKQPFKEDFYYDDENNRTVIDLALVYASPEGYAFSGNLPLAEISFIGKETGEVNLSFDEEQSMVITKETTKFPARFEGAAISVTQ